MSNGSAINRRMFLAGSSAAIGSSMVLPGLAAAAPGAMASAPAYGPLPGVAKLNANENPYGPSPAALKAMDAAMRKGA